MASLTAQASSDGRKLYLIQGSNRTDYVGYLAYENGTLKRVLVDGGYIENGIYYFYLQDHLGNNRVVANANGTVVQVNNYYPYGATFANATTQNVQPYKFGGKEQDTSNDLNWYDFEARPYYATYGAFTTMDPLAEKYPSISPYAYCGGIR
jgi:RHS repeat-associated protein